MADIKVRDLTDTSGITLDNQIMVLTNDEQNQVQNITVENLLSNVLSSDNGNVLEQGTDGKLYVETPENITGDLADLSTINKTSLVNAINEVDGDITAEATTRANADNNLQSQIDAITAASDVTDIVGTYAQLQAYDTAGLADNSIIKVLQDESRQDETTYYRWVITDGVGAWVLIGEEGPYYTISQVDNKFATQETVGNLNNLATSDKSSVVNAMNELASVLDPTQTADYIKNSKAIYSGEVSENALILPQIKEMAHSTFDLSKFIVTGSPNITDDGIASGFSGSNYITTSISISNANTIILKGRVIYATSGTIFGGFGTYYTPRFFFLDSGKVRLYCYDGTTQGNAEVSASNVPVSIGEYLYYECEISNNKRVLKISADGKNWITATNTTVLSLNIASIISTLNIGYVYNDPVSGSIDLKQFSITVDGVEVFSGNKTGIDTIKPDDYTVVGSPTISADGIASSTTTNSSLSPTTSIDFTKPFSIEFSIKNDLNANSTLRAIKFGSDNNWNILNLESYDSSTNKYCIRMQCRDTNGTTVQSLTGNILEMGVMYLFKMEWTGSKYSLKYKRINDTSYTLAGNEISSTYPLNITNVGLTLNLGSTVGISTDLNSFKIYVDGNLVYQPCLKIPYTESKTGSKIVQSVYRDRVADMAEQFGYAPYYTLSDTDFTLPQVELYGYIEKRARDIAHPVAVPFFRLTDEINEDEVRLEGAEVDKGLYLAIEQKLAAYCSASEDTTKIILPNFTNRVPWGANDYGYISAGLPNITGAFETGEYSAGASGAFQNYQTSGQYESGSYESFTIDAKTFDASRSSSIYGNSTTVQPPAFKVRWLARWK